jgi:hypothetical protein
VNARRSIAFALFLLALVLVGLLAWLSIPAEKATTPRSQALVAGQADSAATPFEAESTTKSAAPVARNPAAPSHPDAARAAGARASGTTAPVAGPPLRAPASTSVSEDAAAGEAPEPLRFEISRDGIRGAVDSVLPDLQACYEGWLSVGKPVRGKVRVHLRIEADRDEPARGVISAAEVLDSELHHPLLEACLLNALSQPEFDPPEGGGKVEVTYPLVFEDEEDDG